MNLSKSTKSPVKIFGESESRLSVMYCTPTLLPSYHPRYTHRRFDFIDRDVKTAILKMLRSTGAIPPAPLPEVVEKPPGVKLPKVKNRGKQRSNKSRVWGEVGGMDLMQLNFSNLDADVLDPLEH